MTISNASIESAARMNPSTVYAPLPSGRKVECGCCHTVREQDGEHPILGPLCVWCARAFDYQLHAYDGGSKVRGWETCPFCLETGDPCELHE
jgi:hypothetical protein